MASLLPRKLLAPNFFVSNNYVNLRAKISYSPLIALEAPKSRSEDSHYVKLILNFFINYNKTVHVGGAPCVL